MKLLTTFVLAMMGALVVYIARRRIVFALKTGAILYVVLLFIRLPFSAWSLADKWEDLVWPTIILGSAWVILTWVSTNYAQRRDLERARQRKLRDASGAGRPAR